MEKAIFWFSRNHVAANFLMLLVLIGGLMTWPKLKKEIFPETAIDIVAISVPYPNAAPEEVERGVCVPVEEAIQDLDGIERITSTSVESMGAVLAEVKLGYDTRKVLSDIKVRVDAIDNFPEETEKPVVEELLIKAQVLSIAVSADTDEATLREIAEGVRQDLLNHQMTPAKGKWEKIKRGVVTLLGGEPSITQVKLAGVRNYEIGIEVPEDTLRRFNLNFDQVANAVRFSSLDLPGGAVRTEAGEVLIRANAKRYTAAEFEDIVVASRPDGTEITLEEIARIHDGFEELDVDTRLDAEPTILVNVFRVGDEDTLDLVNLVNDYLDNVAPRTLPEGVNLQIWNDTSVYLKGRMDLLAKNGLWGLLLVFVVLALFLRPSLAFLVSLGIPVAFAGAVALMPTTDISINLISLFAFILVLGIVVDDAIVVGENVFSRMRAGEEPRLAAPRGTHEVGVVVIFGVLTTVAAFTPMLMVGGVSGKIWRNIPWIVIPTLLVSLLQSKFVLPAHLALLPRLSADRKVGPLTRVRRKFTDGLETFVERVYRPVLRQTIRFRYAVVAIFISVFALTMGFVATGWIKFQFFPEVEGEILSAKLTMPNGAPYGQTAEAIGQIEAAAKKLAEHQDQAGHSVVRHMLASIGTQPFKTGFEAIGRNPIADNIGEVTLELSPAADRKVTATELISEWRALTGPVAGALELTFRSESGAGGNAIDLELSGDNLDDLEAAAGEVKAALRKFEGVIDIADSNREGKRELKLELLPGAEPLGITLADVARQVRQAFYGEEAQRLQRGRDEVKVMVRYPADERATLQSLEDMKIRTPDGREVPFTAVARAEAGRGYATIRRADLRRSVRISADVDKVSKKANANEVVAAIKEKVLPEVMKKYPGMTYNFQGEQKDQAQSMRDMMVGFIVALIIMYVLLAIPLRSYLQPLIVMSVIPFGLVGAVVGHVVYGTVLSIMSMCGFIALAGVVVNDSLVLVEYVNRHRDDGYGLRHAVWEAGSKRFRPILLTSLTTFAGLTPMLLETDLQARFLIPMAISLAFGILFATLITLLLVPCVYLILEDFKGRVAKEWRGVFGQKAAAPTGTEAGRAGEA